MAHPYELLTAEARQLERATAGSCRKRDIYRTRTYGLLQVSTGFHRQYMCRIYNAVSRSSSTPQVSQGFTGII
jgi:hypothetical protein